MTQGWLNVVGLGFDLVGVLLLSYEWWVAIRAERREAELLEREQRLKPNPMMPRPSGPHQAVFDHMKENMRFQQQSLRARVVREERRSWFMAALFLIAIGFVLQILGSWPGGLPGLR